MSMPRISLSLFGHFTMDGSAKPLKLSSSKRLLVLLVSQPGKMWTREELAQRIWPEESINSRNRLRTALVELRSSLGDHAKWLGGRHTLGVELTGVDVDLWRALHLVQQIRLAPDDASERALLQELVAIIQDPFLVDEPNSFEEIRRDWQGRLLESLLRLAEIAESDGEIPRAIEVAEQAVRSNPFNERVWMLLLRLHALQGDHVSIAKRFAIAKTELHRSRATSFSKGLIKYADNTRQRGATDTQLSPLESEMVARTFSMVLESDPESALPLLSSEEFRVEVYRSPATAHGLLKTIIAKTDGASPLRMRCLVYAMIACTLSDGADTAVDYGKEVLRFDDDPTRLRATATMLANIYLNRGDEANFRPVWEKAMEYAQLADNVPGVEILRGQKAIFDWYIDKGDLSIHELKTTTQHLQNFPEHNALQGRATLLTYLGAFLAAEGRYAEAKVELESAAMAANQAQHFEVQGQILAPLGLCELMLDRTSTGATKLAEGVAVRLKAKMNRELAWSLFFCAVALDALGEQAKAKRLQDAIEEVFLNGQLKGQVMFEKMLEKRQEKLIDVKPDRRFAPGTTAREVTLSVIAALEDYSAAKAHEKLSLIYR